MPTGNLTRAQFAVAWWKQLSRLPVRPFPRLAPEDADRDGIPDRDDPLPFTASDRTWPEEKPMKLSPDHDGLVDPPPSGKAFNFTGRGARAVKGFLSDHGLPFDPKRGFGWTRDISANHRRRNVFPETLRDTFLFTRTSDTWECELPEGDYEIRVCIGDAGHEQPGQWVSAEGQPLLQDVYTEAGCFQEHSARVHVGDGRLTVRIGRGRPGANTCLNWITIRPIR